MPPTVTVASLPATPQPVAYVEPAEDFGCGVFGTFGITPDAAQFRRCVERIAKPCTTGPADLATLELAVALIDDSAANIPRARTLLDRCNDDAATQRVREHAVSKEHDPNTAPYPSCDVFAATPPTSIACMAEHAGNEHAWLARERRFYPLDARYLFDAATTAFDAYAQPMGEIVRAHVPEVARETSVQSEILALLQTRRRHLAQLHDFDPTTASAGERSDARKDVARNLARIDDWENPEAEVALHTASAAWMKYREAETALYERFHPGSHDAVILMLAREHSDALCAMNSEP